MDWMVWMLAAAVVVLLARSIWLARSLDLAQAESAQRNKELASVTAEISAGAARLDRYAAVVARAPLGILVLARDGRIVQSNVAAKEMLGDRWGAALVQPKISAVVERTFEEGRPIHEEVGIHNPMLRSLRLSSERVGDTDWVVVFIEDVTERNQVNAARTDFVANVSHELKTPLGGLSLLAETLESADDPEVRRKLIGRIGEQAVRMTRLVDDILDLSLVEAAGMEPAVVDLDKVIAAAAAGVRDFAAASQVELDVVSAGEDRAIIGDERQLISAVTNLLGNAVTYTSIAAPPRRVVARTYLRDHEAVVEVADSGVGIPANHQQRIFERFYRVDSARSRETGGTGLGLAIVRHVALNHGGSVELESESGVGSTFRMIIPAEGVEPQ